MSAFAVAIGGKADMPFCTAYVRFDPERTVTSEETSSESGDNSKGNRNLETIWRRILPRHFLHFLSNPLLNIGILSLDDG